MPEGIVTGLSNPSSPAAGLCTLYDLREGVFNFLRDTDRVFVTETMVVDWLNEAYLDLNARLRLKQAVIESTTDTDGLIAAPTDFVEMISLWYEGIPAQIVDDTVFESYSEPGIIALENGLTLTRFFNNNFETYPILDEVDYVLRYVARPALMAELDDQPTAITPELCLRLRKYALSEAYQKQGDTDLASSAMAEYLEGLPGRPRQMHRMRPAPINLIPAAGPFG